MRNTGFAKRRLMATAGLIGALAMVQAMPPSALKAQQRMVEGGDPDPERIPMPEPERTRIPMPDPPRQRVPMPASSLPASSQPAPDPVRLFAYRVDQLGRGSAPLRRGSPQYYSESGNHYFEFQGNGDLVIATSDGRPTWKLSDVTPNYRSAQSVDFSGGSIVVRDAAGNVIWQPAGVLPNTDGRLWLTDSGVLQVRSCGGRQQGGVYWSADDKTGRGAAACSASGSRFLPSGQSGGGSRFSRPQTTGTGGDRLAQGGQSSGGSRFQSASSSGSRTATPPPPPSPGIRPAPASQTSSTGIRQAAAGQAPSTGFRPATSSQNGTAAGARPTTGSQPSGGSALSAIGNAGASTKPVVAPPANPPATPPVTPPAAQLIPPADPAIDKFPIPAGKMVSANREYVSPSGKHKMTVYAGNTVAVATTGNKTLWSSNDVTPVSGGVERFGLTPDGSFVMVGAGDKVLWTAPQARKDPKSTLTITPFGAMQVHASDGQVLWSSDGILSSTQITNLPIPARTMIPAKGDFPSSDGRAFLAFMPDGEMFLKTDKSMLWRQQNATTDFSGAHKVGLLDDGTFATLDKDGKVIWAPPLTRKDPAATVNIGPGPVLQVVASNGDVLWASDGITARPIDTFAAAPTKTCTPETGWDKCLEMQGPHITIFGSKATTYSAMNGIANVYRAMFDRLDPRWPVSTFDGFKVYLTNGEPYREIQTMAPVGTMWADRDKNVLRNPQDGGDFLRGGANANFVWLSEQMICKTGVATRNANLAALKMDKPDTDERDVDQIVHEISHSMEGRYTGLTSLNHPVYKNDGMGPVEGFPISVQGWFGASGTPLSKAYENHLKTIFTERVKFSCAMYKP